MAELTNGQKFEFLKCHFLLFNNGSHFTIVFDFVMFRWLFVLQFNLKFVDFRDKFNCNDNSKRCKNIKIVKNSTISHLFLSKTGKMQNLQQSFLLFKMSDQTWEQWTRGIDENSRNLLHLQPQTISTATPSRQWVERRFISTRFKRSSAS